MIVLFVSPFSEHSLRQEENRERRRGRERQEGHFNYFFSNAQLTPPLGGVNCASRMLFVYVCMYVLVYACIYLLV